MKRGIGVEMKQVVLQMDVLAGRARLLHSAIRPCQPHDALSHTLPYIVGELGAKVLSR